MPHNKPQMYDNEECFNLHTKNEDEKKINPKKVFKGYTAPKGKKKSTVPKGYHKMPDGSLMKGVKHPKGRKGSKDKKGKY